MSRRQGQERQKFRTSRVLNIMFQDREKAGKLLAEKLKSLKRKNMAAAKFDLVLGITRGGVLVAREIAKILSLPLDIIVVKKIGAPRNPELAVGAVGPKASVFWDEELLSNLHISLKERKGLLKIKKHEQEELENKLSPKSKKRSLSEKNIILADDGIATGATVLAACKFLKREKVKSINLAIPVISKDTLGSIKKYFDRVVALEIADGFGAVGEFYVDFPQVEDETVIKILSN